MSQENKDKTDAAEARTQQTKGFMQQVASLQEGGRGLGKARRVSTTQSRLVPCGALTQSGSAPGP